MGKVERRRYFRIDETIGLSVQLLGGDAHAALPGDVPEVTQAPAFVAEHDNEIEKLILGLEPDHPKVARLASLLNQKLERVAMMVAADNQLVTRIAHRVQEVNISACGMGFGHEEPIAEGSKVRIDMTLLPDEQKVSSDGIVIACEKSRDDEHEYYCRVDFFGMSVADQEVLIQHVVQSQATQLKSRQKL